MVVVVDISRFPTYRAIPFRDSIAEGVSRQFSLFSCGITQASPRYPFCGGGYRASTSHALPGGKAQKKGEGVSHRIGHVETPKTA